LPFRTETISSQRTALKRIAELIAKGSIDPAVRRAALAITRDVDARDDLGELEALYTAVKHGTDAVPGLRKGVRYVADPRAADFFTGAGKLLEECRHGACGGDCDDATILIGAMASSLGFKVGARAYARPSDGDGFTHIYAVASIPKRGPWPANYGGHGLDTTVESARVGWEPKKGKVLTYWVE
jgi:hypothetical protein